MAQQLTVLAAPPAALSSVLRTHVPYLPNICNSRSRDSDALSWPPQISTHVTQACIHVHRNKIVYCKSIKKKTKLKSRKEGPMKKQRSLLKLSVQLFPP